MTEFRIRLLIPASNLPVALSTAALATIPVLYGPVVSGGSGPPGGDGELNFSVSANSGLLALVMEDL